MELVRRERERKKEVRVVSNFYSLLYSEEEQGRKNEVRGRERESKYDRKRRSQRKRGGERE